VKREPGFDGGTRLVQSTKLRERGPQRKMWLRMISISLDRPSKPRDRLLATGEVVLRDPRVNHPGASHRIARTEAQGLADMRLRFFGATDKDLTKPDKGMGAGEILIQRQRMFAFGDALCSALGHYVDESQLQMGTRMVRDRRRDFGQLRFGRREGRHRIGHKQKCAGDRVRGPRSDERVDIVGIGGERAIEKAARSRDIERGEAPY
jgi:hypothetical protein